MAGRLTDEPVRARELEDVAPPTAATRLCVTSVALRRVVEVRKLARNGMSQAATARGLASLPEAHSCTVATTRQRGACGDDICVEHHERQSPVALERMPIVELDDALLFVLVEPVVTGHQGVVLVRLAIALAPIEELAARDPHPADDPLLRDLGSLAQLAHEVHHAVSRIVGNPATRQGSPSSFFRSTYSWLISAIT